MTSEEDDYLTRAILGPVHKIELGIPSACAAAPWPSVVARIGGHAPLSGGRVLERLKSAGQGVLANAWALPLALKVAAVIVVLATALNVSLLWRSLGRTPALSPSVDAVGTTNAASQMDRSNSPLPIAQAKDPGVPSPQPGAIAVSDLPFGLKTAVPPGALAAVAMPQAPAVKSLAPAPAPTRPNERARQEPAASLLVMDGKEDKKVAERPSPGKPAAPAKESAVTMVPNAVPQRDSDDAAKVTIVDIAKDGAYVLITNPKTRLPERFAVGQKIHSGETVQKIDPATGKVQLDKRTIGLQ